MSNIDKQALRKTAEKAQEHGVFNMDIHSQTVLALLDELEKMQAQSSKWCEAFHKAVSVGARYEERIAELEARELVVNLPAYVDGRTLGYGEVNHMIDLCADAIEKAGHSAGIITKVGG